MQSVSGGSQAETLVINSRTRRAYQISNTNPSSVSAFDVRNPARPKLLGTIEYPGLLRADGPHLVDEQRGQIFLPIVGLGGSSAASPFAGIAVLDEDEFRPGNANAFRTLTPRTNSAVYGLLSLVGMRFEPTARKLLMLFDSIPQQGPEQIVNAAADNTSGRQPLYLSPLVQWDADTGEEDWFVLEACPSAAAQANQERSPDWGTSGPWVTPFLSGDGKTVNFICFSGSQNAQFAQLELGKDGQPTGSIERFLGPPFVRRVLVDPERERTHLVMVDSYAVTFDWARRRLVGTVALSPQQELGWRTPVGIDPASGRWYALIPKGSATLHGQQLLDPGGLLMVDGRRTPLSQALAFPEFAAPTINYAPRINVLPDPERGRRYVFVRPMQPDGITVETFWRIIEDSVPVTQDPPLGELDRTVDTNEVEGKTDRSYAGQATAYGWRALLVSFGVGVEEVLGPCPAANREIVAASVQSASLSSIVAAARAFPTDADQRTREDLGDATRCWPAGFPDFRTPDPPEALRGFGPGWGQRSGYVQGDLDPVLAAECVGDGNGEGHDPRVSGSGAHSDCSQKEEKLEAWANYPAVQFGSISVGRAYSATRMHRDPKLGVVVETRALTEGVEIAGIGSIEAVRSYAYARANGRKPRPGDPVRATWEVEFCGVRTGDFQQQGCEFPDAALAALNEAGRGQVLFVRPSPDPNLRQGSPGGFVAGIQRDEGDAQIASLENNDSHPAVPGLEVQLRNDDNNGTHRTIVQLAGVQAVAAYGISLIPEDRPFDDIPGPGGIIPPIPVPPVAPSIINEPPNLPGPADDIVRVVKKGLEVFLRASVDALVAAGIWSIFATPVYLVVRRRRLRFAG